MSTVVLDTNVVSFLMKGHRLADSYPADFRNIDGIRILSA